LDRLVNVAVVGSMCVCCSLEWQTFTWGCQTGD